MAPDAVAALDLWDQAQGHSPIGRALHLAVSADPDLGTEKAALMPIGERNRLLLRLRSTWSTGALGATTDCPECDATNEVEAPLSQLLDTARGDAPTPVEIDGRVISWRPLNSIDLMHAARQPSGEAVEHALLQRCLVEVPEQDGTGTNFLADRRLRSALAEAIERADPLAEILFDVACVACGASFSVDLDVPGIVWKELSDIARNLLADVDTLAKAYGWTEPECLALTPTRRDWYVQMAIGS